MAGTHPESWIVLFRSIRVRPVFPGSFPLKLNCEHAWKTTSMVLLCVLCQHGTGLRKGTTVPLKDWAKLVWEPDDKTPPPPLQAHMQQQQVNPVVAALSPALGGTSAAPNPAYDTLLAHTSFESTDVGKVYSAYYNKLARITDEHQRRATALDLASVDQKAISNAFVRLNEQLRTEEEHFDQSFTARQQQDVADPTKQVDDLAKQIEALQQQKAQLEARIQPALDRLKSVKAQFEQAMERRTRELAEQRAAFIGD
jgi:hypothetical protein